jgi:hypothetical protein
MGKRLMRFKKIDEKSSYDTLTMKYSTSAYYVCRIFTSVFVAQVKGTSSTVPYVLFGTRKKQLRHLDEIYVVLGDEE